MHDTIYKLGQYKELAMQLTEIESAFDFDAQVSDLKEKIDNALEKLEIEIEDITEKLQHAAEASQHIIDSLKGFDDIDEIFELRDLLGTAETIIHAMQENN